MSLIVVMPCPACKGECNTIMDVNPVQMSRCPRCGCLFQFSLAVRTLTPSSSGEVKTGRWLILEAPAIEEIHLDGDIHYRLRSQMPDVTDEPDNEGDEGGRAQ